MSSTAQTPNKHWDAWEVQLQKHEGIQTNEKKWDY